MDSSIRLYLCLRWAFRGTILYDTELCCLELSCILCVQAQTNSPMTLTFIVKKVVWRDFVDLTKIKDFDDNTGENSLLCLITVATCPFTGQRVCARVHTCAVTVDLTHWFLGCAKSLAPTLWSSGITDVTGGTLCITTPLASSSFSFHVLMSSLGKNQPTHQLCSSRL